MVSNMATIKKMMAKLLKDTNAPWLEYADDYQSECAFIYFWFDNLDPESKEGGDFFKAGLDASPDYKWATDSAWDHADPELVRNFWVDKKWQWVKFWDSVARMLHSEHMDTALEDYLALVQAVLEEPIKSKFVEFAEPWVDVKNQKEFDEFSKKHYTSFRTAWIMEIRKAAPTDEDIFGNIWNLDGSPDPVDDIKEDEPEDQDEEIIPKTEKLIFGGSTAWVNEGDGEIKLSKNSPGEEWMLIESVNTGHKGEDGEILFVPSVLEGVSDWWVGLGNPDSDINRISKTKIIISGAGEFSKSWLRRYFFVKDKEGDLVISY